MPHKVKFAVPKPKSFTAQELDNMKRQFAVIDANHDGVLSAEELTHFSKVYEIDTRFVKLAYLVFDGDQSGGLSFEEYVDFINIARNFDRDKRSFYRRVFDAIDKDKSGAIDGAEFQKLCAAFDMALTVQEAADIVKSMDYTGTGKLIFDDLCHWLGLPRGR
jgi:Ca2+-binding EF-hand superfamily protein